MSATKHLSHRSSEFRLTLLLPRTTFHPGDHIPFEVQIENPNGSVLFEFLVVTLIQKSITVSQRKRKPSSNPAKAFKTETRNVAEEASAPGFHETSWFGFLKIPEVIMPTLHIWDPPMLNVIDNNYVLQIGAACESYSILSEEYPIRIEYTFSRVPHRTQPQQLTEMSLTPSHRSEDVSRSLGIRETSILTSPSLSILGPPRYSSLSLDSIASRAETFSGSLETLPPDYEDLLTSEASAYSLR